MPFEGISSCPAPPRRASLESAAEDVHEPTPVNAYSSLAGRGRASRPAVRTARVVPLQESHERAETSGWLSLFCVRAYSTRISFPAE
jgi:hypothetical protein